MTYIHGGDIYTNEYSLDFSSNICPFGMNEAVYRAALRGIERSAAYPDTRCRKLRRKIGEVYCIAPEWTAVGNGAAEVLFTLVLAEKPRKGMILAPAFQEYEQALQSVGSQVLVWERQPDDGFALGDEFIRYLEQELRQGLDMVFFCTPDNPSGAVLSQKILRTSLALCERYGARMVVDESFWEFAYDSAEDTMLPAVRQSKAVFLLRSFTKMYGMPGLRLGYGICSDEELLARIEEARQPWSVSVPAQEAGLAALDEDDWRHRVKDYVSGQRAWLTDELIGLGCRVYPSEANYLLFYLGQEEQNLAEALKGQGILIRDCSNYRGLGHGYYRVAVKKKEENRHLVDAVRDVMQQKKGLRGGEA